MPCTQPKHGYSDPDDNGRFTHMSPDHLYHDSLLTVNCGHCYDCLVKRQADWSLRAAHELQYHDESSFTLLTYRDSAIASHGDLVHRHWQLFAKRLRESYGAFRFLLSHEKSPTTGRPHIHLLCFGLDLMEEAEPIQTNNQMQLYRSPRLDALWGHGYCHIGTATPESAGYTAGYVTGKLQDHMDSWRPARFRKRVHNSIHRRTHAYQAMSTQPGLGFKFYQDYKHQMFDSDGALRTGPKHYQRIPQYYRTLYQKDHPERYLAWQDRLHANAEKHGRPTPEDLDRIERVQHLKLKATPRTSHP